MKEPLLARITLICNVSTGLQMCEESMNSYKVNRRLFATCMLWTILGITP